MKNKRIHFIGIGGSGMLGLAEWCLLEGFQVSGSDPAAGGQQNKELIRLTKLGARIDPLQSGLFLEDAGLIVRSTAISESNFEFIAARKLGKSIISRGKFLSEMSRHRTCIAICGSHGKSTTTALTGHALRVLWPAHVYLGATARNFASSFHWGHAQRLIAEVDESDGTFLDFQNDLTVLTGLSNDHENHYGNKTKLFDAFEAFIQKSSVLNRPILCKADPEVRKFLEDRKIETKINAITYGNESDCDISYFNLRRHGSVSTFDISVFENVLKDIELPLVGEHNVLNCLPAFGIASELGLSLDGVKQKLRSFKGVARRMELVLSAPEADVYSDYAHNPQKIAAVLKALQSAYGEQNVTCFFEPHRYSRLATMWNEFLEALARAKNTYTLPLYTAGEEPIAGINVQEIEKGVKKLQGSRFLSEAIIPTPQTFSDILKKLLNASQKNNSSDPKQAFVFVGAGKSHEYALIFATELLKHLESCREKCEKFDEKRGSFTPEVPHSKKPE